MASTSNRRIRCFLCGELVPRSYLDTDFLDEDASFALVTLRISNKFGCICSGCIEHYALKLGTTFEFSSGKFGDDDESSKESLEDYGFKDNDEESQTAITTTNPQSAYDTKELLLFKAKYDCLDYSLDSLLSVIKRTVFGQDEAAKQLLYAMYFNQMANLMEELGDDPFKHKHILLIGGTGVGKTLLATTAAKTFGAVYSVSNATPITSAGYIGDKIESILERLLDTAGGNVELAQNGIVILDEIDKKRSISDGDGRDVVGKAVQQELLKLLEPSTIWIKRNTIPFHTGNLTVILMGAFVGLEDIVKSRTKKAAIGFASPTDNQAPQKLEITQDDLIQYGFIPEMIGRVPIICKLNDLTHDTIVDIIYSQLERYNKFFKVKDFDFFFDPLLINKVAYEVLEAKTGARDVEVKLDEILRPALYRIFQSQPSGICEIGENGEIHLLRRKTKDPKVFETIDFPAVEKYIDNEN